MKILSLLLLLATQSAMAASVSGKALYFGLGTTLLNMGKYTSSDEGSASITGQMYIPLTLALRFKMGANSALIPNISYTPMKVTASDEVSKKFLALGVNWAFNSASDFTFKAGAGLLMYSISGSGGTTVLNNGTGTATFYLPDGTVTSKLVYLDLGVTQALAGDFCLDLDVWVSGAMTSKRSFSTQLSISKGVF